MLLSTMGETISSSGTFFTRSSYEGGGTTHRQRLVVRGNRDASLTRAITGDQGASAAVFPILPESLAPTPVTPTLIERARL